MACVQTPQLNNKNYYVQFDGLEGMSSGTGMDARRVSAQQGAENMSKQAKNCRGLLMSAAIASTDL